MTPSSLRWTALGLVAFLLLALRPAHAEEPPAIPLATPAVVINELLTHTDEPQVDSIELWNASPAPVDISNWCLEQGDKDCDYILPAGSLLPPNGYLLLEKNEFEFGLSEAGEMISLIARDANDQLTGDKHVVTFGAAANGVSLGRVVTTDGREFFVPQRSVTLGAANGEPAIGPVIIAELNYLPAAGLLEYVELLNVSPLPVALYDSTNPQNTWRLLGPGNFDLPTDLVLAAGASLFVVQGDPADFRAAYGLPVSARVMGPVSGELKDTGELVRLLRPDTPNLDGTVPYLVVDELEYLPHAPWPVLSEDGIALQRANLAGIGQEPTHWRAAPVALEAEGPEILLDSARVLPGARGRTLVWNVEWEWKVESYRLLRSTAGRSSAVQVGGLVVAKGGRHAAAAYRVDEDSAEDALAYTYWIEALSPTGAGRDFGPVPSAPVRRVWLPAIGR